MKIKFYLPYCFSWAFVLLMLSGTCLAGNVLENISYSSMPGDKIQIQLHFSSHAPDPGVFTIDSPARIVLDFEQVSLKLKQKKRTIGLGLARSVKAVESRGRTRVVINLVTLTDYNTEKNGNTLLITLNKVGQSQAGKFSQQKTIQDIDFRRGKDGEANILIKFTTPVENISIKDEGEKIIVDMVGVALPRDLERRLDVVDFATPVKLIDTYTDGNNVRMVIDAQGEYDHLGYQMGNQFTIEIKELSAKQKAERIKARFGYSGERLSLIFQDIEVRAVLQLIADFTGKNMVTSDTVSGNVTLRLKNVPWDQALDIILKTRGLAMREEGNVIRVAPMEEIAAIEKLELESSRQIASLLPRVRETIQLNYRRATAVVELLKEIGESESEKNTADPSQRNGGGEQSGGEAPAEGEESGAGLVGANALVIGDDRTNKIIVYDTRQNIAQLRKLIEEIDVPTKQVLIDARIVSATDDFSRNLGVTWHAFNTNDIRIGSGGSSAIYTGNDASVNLGNAAASLGRLGISTGILGGGWLVDLELQAAEVEGTSELISSPRVVTANGQEAEIKQGIEIPYQESGGDGTTTTAFKEAVLSLSVTPNITPNNKIEMMVAITKDSVNTTTVVGGVPSVNTQALNTNVVVANGDTVVLGGVFELDTQDGEDKIPLFGDIPVIGHAFKNTKIQNNKKELLIFITPKVLDAELSVK